MNPQTPKPELLPCLFPFCGSSNVLLTHRKGTVSLIAHAFVYCMDCGSQGPRVSADSLDEAKEHAVTAWNRRTPATEPAAGGEAGPVDTRQRYDHKYEPGAYGVCRRCGEEEHGRFRIGVDGQYSVVQSEAEAINHGGASRIPLHPPAAQPLPAHELQVAREFMQTELDELTSMEKQGCLSQHGQDKARSIAILLKAADQPLPAGGVDENEYTAFEAGWRSALDLDGPRPPLPKHAYARWKKIPTTGVHHE